MTAMPAARLRDERLDFFRGLTMFIIFVAHADINPLNDWIPAQFGFSSGAEVFVFCSGAASAAAFGRAHVEAGFLLGTARVAQRIWQVYWAHLCSAFVIIALMIFAQPSLPGIVLQPIGAVAADPLTALLALVTLRWLPGYLDILPMYLVLLAFIPIVMALRRMAFWLPAVFVLVLYGSVWTFHINLPGDPWTHDGWFFNPFAWQLVFFTGFAFNSGWIPVPRLGRPALLAVAIAFLIISVPVSSWHFRNLIPKLELIHTALIGPNDKTDLHPLRYVHFLAVAYVALSVVENYRTEITKGAGATIVLVGQQSLAVFLASIVTARASSVAFQLFGTGAAVTFAVNALGFSLIVATAALTRWFKSAPWSRRRSAATKPPASEAIGAMQATG